MRRILFYSENFCGDEVKGGLEVATYRIAKALKDTGNWDVYNAFCKKFGGKGKGIYTEIIELSHSGPKFEKELGGFIDKNEIDVVVNMSRFFRQKWIVSAANKSSRKDIKVVFMQHFAPGSEFKKATFKSGRHLLKLNPYNPLYWLRASIYPLIKLPRNINLANIYKTTYETSNKVILLSKDYKEEYEKIAGINAGEKFDFVQNIFEVPSAEHLVPSNKEKRVLILSRMDEIQKRLSLALKVWARIEQDPELKVWELDIVGAGHNTDIVKRLIRKLGLKNAKYHGWQNREPFLERASILMSTSEYEGLPLSILEAQAFGCVPIAFNSYASVRDVIYSGENGFLIDKFGDIDSYEHQLKELMINDEKRKAMAQRGKESSNSFSSSVVVEKWVEILSQL